MATIRQTSGGNWQCIVRKKGFKNRSRAFRTKAEAIDWGQKIEALIRRTKERADFAEDSWVKSVDDAMNDAYSWLRTMHREAKARAQRSGKEFSLSLDVLKIIALESNGKCTVTGIGFSFAKLGNDARKPFAPSLDRIDSSLGYVEGNCRLVCTVVNLAMSSWGEDVVLVMAKALVHNYLTRDLGNILYVEDADNWRESAKALRAM